MKLLAIIFILISLLSTMSLAEEKISILKHYDFENPEKFVITSNLKEISGIANSNDGNIFAINDETGIIFKLNPSNGNVIKKFFLGSWTVEADFEGIAASDKYIYTITSGGKLYKFKEGGNEQAVTYETKSLPFSSKFDLEGLYYDKDLNGLLIAAKDYPGKKHEDHRSIYFFAKKDADVQKDPLITISLKKLKKKFDVKDFYPSGITKHPKTGTYLIISAKGDNVIIEIDVSGNIIGTKQLKEKTHRQPEGIAILSDDTLLISDEAAGKKPTITLYKYQK